jgi:hypothetical protein
MPLPQTLLDVATDLATDAAAKAAFTADPEGFLADRHLEDLSAEDLGTALEHVTDTLPPELGAQLGEVDPDADPGEVFATLVDIEPATGLEDLAFGHGEEGADETSEDGDVGDDTVDVLDAIELEEPDETPASGWHEPADSHPEADDDLDDEADLDLDFGAGAELPDDLPE